MPIEKRWDNLLDSLHADGRYRRLAVPGGVDLSSNDYLGFGKEPLPWPVEGLPASGLASRLLRDHAIWDDVEAALAQWHDTETALMFTSGYAANEGLLSTLIQPEDFLASDELNHASIIDGARLSRAERCVFAHNDIDQLEGALRRANRNRSSGRELFVVTESLFGMDGDVAPLTAYADVCDRYAAHLIVDEAHATGCFGPRGSGLIDEAGLRGRVLASIHTGGKALAVMGAYVCCRARLREVLINRCRHFIFTTALPPIIGAWWLRAIERVQKADAQRDRLHEASCLFRQELRNRGLDTRAERYIVPVILGDDDRASAAAARLQAAGWDIREIRPPSVPEGTARLRISIHADHDSVLLVNVAQAVAASLKPILAGMP